VLTARQVLKYEAYHESALARLLVRRALRSPARVGHYLFWHLKASPVVLCSRTRLV
jgi:phosphatidylinositol-4,5-bisphosphate 3-kinase